MYSEMKPKFVKRFAEGGAMVIQAMSQYVAEVQSGAFPAREHSFGPPRERPVEPEPTGARSLPVNAPSSYGPASDES
jgi:hypothetical protein